MEWNGDILVKCAVGGKVASDFGEVSADEGFVEKGWVEEG